MLSRQEAYDAYHALVYPGRALKADYARYQAAVKDIEREFRAWLEEEYAYGLPSALMDELWNRAWSDGHSGGYQEVENYYDEWSTFARHIKEALDAD